MNKFKANIWINGKKYDSNDGMYLSCEQYVVKLSAGKIVGTLSDAIISLFTGVLDANERPLYDGDIVSYKGVEGKIAFFAGMFLIEYYDQTDSGPIGFLQTKDLFFVKSSYSF